MFLVEPFVDLECFLLIVFFWFLDVDVLIYACFVYCSFLCLSLLGPQSLECLSVDRVLVS